MHKIQAEIVDIFSSVQGEGIFLGARQVFVRFKKCNLSCSYCDEPRNARAELYSPEALLEKVSSFEETKGAHHSVSLTGGEPLCYADFLKAFLPLLKKKGMRSYLETNGTQPEELGRVIDFIDIIAMDIKLPSSTGERAFWSEHSQFLKIALRKKVFVKAIVTQGTDRHDIEKAIALVTGLGKKIPFILQPATPVRPHDKGVAKERLLEFIDIGTKHNLEGMRVIPQMHKLWGIK